MKKSLPLAALLGVGGLLGLLPDSDAAPIVATLSSVSELSDCCGATAWNRSLDTSTWTFDAATGTAVQTGGTYSAQNKAGFASIYRHTMTGVTLSSGVATGTTWACIEGTFGTQVSASVCGNYNYGPDLINDSIYTPTATGATVTIGGDDGAFGPPQTLVNSYSNMVAASLGGGQYSLTNHIAGVGIITGYQFVFSTVPAPPAVWLLGTGIAGLGGRRWLRRRIRA